MTASPSRPLTDRQWETLATKPQLTTMEAASVLHELGGHAFITPELAAKIAAPFDAAVSVEAVTNEGPAGFFTKGLYVPDMEIGTTVRGVTGYRLAEAIAQRLGAPSSGKLGHGFRFREAMAFIWSELSLIESHTADEILAAL